MLTFKPPEWGSAVCARCSEHSVVNDADDGKRYCLKCVDELIALGEGQRYQGTAHRPNNPVWQVNYQPFTTADFRKMIDEHSRQPLFNPVTEKLLSYLISKPNSSWADAAEHINRSRQTVRGILVEAVRVFHLRLPPVLTEARVSPFDRASRPNEEALGFERVEFGRIREGSYDHGKPCGKCDNAAEFEYGVWYTTDENAPADEDGALCGACAAVMLLQEAQNRQVLIQKEGDTVHAINGWSALH